MAGRGLGHTGGTIDKLESIRGYKSQMTIDEIVDVVDRVGCCIIGQTGDLAPADKVLYAIRDTTATTESLPLIAGRQCSITLIAGRQCSIPLIAGILHTCNIPRCVILLSYRSVIMGV